jgi:hypothetical protein
MVRKNVYCSGSYKRVSETLLSDIRSVYPLTLTLASFAGFTNWQLLMINLLPYEAAKHIIKGINVPS